MPAGVEYPINDNWRERVLRALEERGWKQSRLARAAGIDRRVLSDLLAKKTSRSRYIPEINMVLGWTPPAEAPAEAPPEPQEDRIQRVFSQLSPFGQARVLELALAFLEEETAKRPSQ